MKYSTTAKMGSSTTANVGFEAFGVSVGLSSTFSYESVTSTEKSTVTTLEPNFPGKVMWQQTITYQTDRGPVVYPTPNI